MLTRPIHPAHSLLMETLVEPNPDIDGGLTSQRLELNRDRGGSEVAR